MVDKLARVWRSSGKEEWVLVHVEVQSQEEKAFAKRMFVYNYRLFDRYNRKVASFAVLGDNRPAWRPDRFGYELWGTEVGIKFATAKLLDYAADEAALESDSNLFAPVVLAHLKTLETADDDEARRVSLVRQVKELYARGLDADEIRRLYRVIDAMMSLPKPLAELAWNEIHDFEQEKGMPLISTAERIGIEKGLAEGLTKGREEGREEGRQEGLAIGARRSLLEGIEVALEMRFAAPGVALLDEIQRIEDVELLRKILGAIKHADSPEALRPLWPKS
ncbi:MAG TPA: hypothetical protein VFW87_23945 [Pirellulales bacterium]|nr:hypothetical protein [Pirellulales bacterium]